MSFSLSLKLSLSLSFCRSGHVFSSHMIICLKGHKSQSAQWKCFSTTIYARIAPWFLQKWARMMWWYKHTALYSVQAIFVAVPNFCIFLIMFHFISDLYASYWRNRHPYCYKMGTKPMLPSVKAVCEKWFFSRRIFMWIYDNVGPVFFVCSCENVDPVFKHPSCHNWMKLADII